MASIPNLLLSYLCLQNVYKELKEEYFTTHENCVIFKFQCLSVKFYGNTTTLICSYVVFGCFHATIAVLVLNTCGRNCMSQSHYFILLLSTLQITVMKSLCQHFECHTYHHTTTLYFIIFYYRTNIMLKWIKKKMKSRSWTSYF